MSGPARVESIDTIRAFRAALFKFREAANVALSDAESEMVRTLTWLETEQIAYWQGQIRKRNEIVSRAKEAVRQKKLFKDSVGRTPSAVDEEKALQKAMRALAEAEQKHVACRQYLRRLDKEINLYKGSVQRFTTSVQSDIPLAATRLDTMIASLEAYLALGASGADFGPVGSADAAAPPPPPPDLADSEEKPEDSPGA